MPTITSTSTSDTSPSSRVRSARTGWKCRRKTVRDSRSRSGGGASEGTCRRRLRGSFRFLRSPEHQHRQECLCHTILPYFPISGACEGDVAQTLLSVLWQQSVPEPANPLQSRAMKSVTSALLVLAITVTVSAATKPKPAPFNVVEASISDMQAALKDGRVTSHELVQQYLIRIATYEDKLHAAITVNPNALKEADERDRERAAGKIRGPLHGIPIALKDNIQTTDLLTTGGALAFANLVPPYDATLTKNLRDGGAIIMAKTQLTELANWVAGNPPMPTNYNALNGYGFNPYDPRRDPRTETGDGRPALATGGSSSGAGTTGNFWAANVGSETSGSILSPSNQNMLAAIKPTVGRISRYGIIPITADQDTAGPMAKFVTDAAIMFGVLEGNNPDANDSATTRCTPPSNHDYTQFLKKDGLKGARIGIPRTGFYEKFTAPGGTSPRGGLNPEQTKAMNEAIAVLKDQGAIIVDPADIPSVVDKNAADNYFLWGVCTDMDDV